MVDVCNCNVSSSYISQDEILSFSTPTHCDYCLIVWKMKKKLYDDVARYSMSYEHGTSYNHVIIKNYATFDYPKFTKKKHFIKNVLIN
jgi:beta-galactosidase GanA